MKKITSLIILITTIIILSACSAEIPEPQVENYSAPAQIDETMRVQTADFMLTLIEERALLNQKVENHPLRFEVVEFFQDFAVTLELMLYEYPQADPNLEAYILSSSKLYSEYAYFLENSKKDIDNNFTSEGISLLATVIQKDENTDNLLWDGKAFNESGSNTTEKELASKLKGWELNTSAMIAYLNNHYEATFTPPTPTLLPATAIPAPTENPNPLITLSECHLKIGQVVHLLENSRLWTEPSVAVADAVDGTPGSAVYILQGPNWGLIKHNAYIYGWWWQVSVQQDGVPMGWIWEENLAECR